MGDVLPFLLPGRGIRNSPSLPVPPLRPDPHNPLSGTDGCLKVKEIREALLHLFEEPDVLSCCECSITEGFVEETEESRLDRVLALEEIVVFSLEIQQTGFAGQERKTRDQRPAGWGDVFVKVGDEYVFLFTVYTARYVREQFQRFGERIRPSSSDIILHRELLGPQDIIRAVIKWANRYSPRLAGKPIFLEEPSVLQTLVCDPGVEITCSPPA